MPPLLTDLRTQAEVCADLGSMMYADLLGAIAHDVETGGVCAGLLSAYANAPSGEAVPLRLLGSVHRLVLQRRAGSLATFYPSVGGRWEPAGGWLAFQSLVTEQPEEVASWLDRPPQTNEIGRSAALMGGLLTLPEDLRQPLRLNEIGASAGLNLLVDQLAFVDDAQHRFGSSSPDALVMERAWSGRALRPWPDQQVRERSGCDVMPIDPRTTEGRLALTAYVWADQVDRLERLRRVLAIAQAKPVTLRQQSAAEFVDGLRLVPDTTTVLWHSVMWQYLSASEQQSIESSLRRLGAQATPASPLVRLSFEPTGRLPEERGIFLQQWVGTPGDGRPVLIGTAPPHGLPCHWH